MSLILYRLMHLFGLILLFISLGAIAFHSVLGRPEPRKWKRVLAITHGFGMFFLILAGFGMLHRLGITSPYPSWVWIKLFIWLCFGLMIALLRRVPSSARFMWWVMPLMGLTAATLGLLKTG